MKKLEKAAAKVINSAIDFETFGWPPVCNGVFYQPERPKVKPERKAKANALRK